MSRSMSGRLLFCITRKRLRGNFCYQAFTLIDVPEGAILHQKQVNECNRDFSPTTRRQPEKQGNFIGSRHL